MNSSCFTNLAPHNKVEEYLSYFIIATNVKTRKEIEQNAIKKAKTAAKTVKSFRKPPKKQIAIIIVAIRIR